MPIREEFSIQDPVIRNAFREVIRELNRAVDWHYVGQPGEPAFENSWANIGGNYELCAFGLDIFNMLYIKGRVDSGVVNTTIFTLPKKYRPIKTQLFAVITEPDYGQLSVDLNGVVKLIA